MTLFVTPPANCKEEGDAGAEEEKAEAGAWNQPETNLKRD